MKVLDLFSGIGGMSLGLERAGMQTIQFCEIEPFCREVLKRHWPGVPIHDDIRSLRGDDYRGVDIIAGGFPCQDASVAGKGAGLAGERTGLWREFARLVAECRPRWVLAENVPGLRTRGADRVLSDLETLGYTARPLVVGAWAVGAPHRRDRVWIVADRDSGAIRNESGRCSGQSGAGETDHRELGAAMANRDGRGFDGIWKSHRRTWSATDDEGASGHIADGCDGAAMEHAAGRGFGERGGAPDPRHGGNADGTRSPMGNSNRSGSQERSSTAESGDLGFAIWKRHMFPAGPGPYQHEWEPPRVLSRTQSGMGSDVDGLPERLVPRERREALRALGNSVVPQVVEAIGRAIMSVA